MRLLADENFPLPTIEALREAGHEVRPRDRSGLILFRIHPATPQNVTPLVIRAMDTKQEWPGHASIVTVNRVLMVRLRGPSRG